jgi:hypothetical protein
MPAIRSWLDAKNLSLWEREKSPPLSAKAGARGILKHGRLDPLSPRERATVRGKGMSIPPHRQPEASTSILEKH